MSWPISRSRYSRMRRTSQIPQNLPPSGGREGGPGRGTDGKLRRKHCTHVARQIKPLSSFSSSSSCGRQMFWVGCVIRNPIGQQGPDRAAAGGTACLRSYQVNALVVLCVTLHFQKRCISSQLCNLVILWQFIYRNICGQLSVL